MVFIFERKGEDLLVEIFAFDVESGSAFFFKFFLVHDLSFKAGVVCARHPERALAAHTGVTDHNILDRDEHRMSGMQMTICIRRRHDNGVGFAVFVRQVVRIKKARLLPFLIDLGFDFGVVFRI